MGTWIKETDQAIYWMSGEYYIDKLEKQLQTNGEYKISISDMKAWFDTENPPQIMIIVTGNVPEPTHLVKSQEWYPLATRDDKDAHNGGDFVMGSPPRGVLHTTDGNNYAGARDAYFENNSWPHFTVTFERESFKVYQHLSINVAARSLIHQRGKVETNRQHAIQIEIVGDEKDSSNFPEKYLDGIATLMRWIESNAGVPRTSTVKFNPLGHEEQRMSDRDWLNYSGWCGHQHVPNNDHEDPGKIDIAYLLNFNPSSIA